MKRRQSHLTVFLQHCLGTFDFHFTAPAEHPPVESGACADQNGRPEVALIHHLCGDIQPKLVDEVFHQAIFAEERYLYWFICIVHLEHFPGVFYQIQICWGQSRWLAQNLRPSADTVYTEGVDLVAGLVKPHDVIEVTVPNQAVGAENIGFPWFFKTRSFRALYSV